jgi:hypothetical protein
MSSARTDSVSRAPTAWTLETWVEDRPTFGTQRIGLVVAVVRGTRGTTGGTVGGTVGAGPRGTARGGGVPGCVPLGPVTVVLVTDDDVDETCFALW